MAKVSIFIRPLAWPARLPNCAARKHTHSPWPMASQVKPVGELAIYVIWRRIHLVSRRVFNNKVSKLANNSRSCVVSSKRRWLDGLKGKAWPPRYWPM